MKPFILILFILAFFSSCKKHTVVPVNQLSLLPPATQTGARTFGCLVNGKAFVPQNRNLLEGPDLQCNYIYTSGGYYLTVGSSNTNSDGSIIGIILQTDSLKVVEGEVLPLTKYATAGLAYGSYSIFATPSIPYYRTNQQQTGQLNVTHLDTVKQIVSGTFYFTAVNNLSDTVKITDGRFDMPYTR